MIKVLTHYTINWKDLASVTIESMSEYCEKHGYEFINWEVAEFKKYTGIHKISLIWNALDYGDVSLVLDADCLISNYNYRIEDFIDDSHDFFVCKDINGINTGSFIIRYTKWSENLIAYIDDKIVKNQVDCEQNALEQWIQEKGMERIKILPHPSINSYPIDYYYPSYGKIGYVDGEIVTKPTHKKGAWKEGDFICHAPGLPLTTRIEIFKNIKIIK